MTTRVASSHLQLRSDQRSPAARCCPPAQRFDPEPALQLPPSQCRGSQDLALSRMAVTTTTGVQRTHDPASMRLRMPAHCAARTSKPKTSRVASTCIFRYGGSADTTFNVPFITKYMHESLLPGKRMCFPDGCSVITDVRQQTSASSCKARADPFQPKNEYTIALLTVRGQRHARQCPPVPAVV